MSGLQAISLHTKSICPSEACVSGNIPPPPPPNNSPQHNKHMHIIARTIKQSLSQTSIPLVLKPLARQRRNTLWVTSRISCRESQSGAKATKKQHMVVATGNLSSRHSHESHWAPNCKRLSAKLEVLSGRITKPKQPQLHLNVSRLTSVCNRLCLPHGGVGTVPSD